MGCFMQFERLRLIIVLAMFEIMCGIFFVQILFDSEGAKKDGFPTGPAPLLLLLGCMIVMGLLIARMARHLRKTE
jgi:hypothetical protein